MYAGILGSTHTADRVMSQTRDPELSCKDLSDSRMIVIQTDVRSSRPSCLRILETPTVCIRYGTAGRRIILICGS